MFLKQTTEDYLKTIYLLNYGNNGVRAVEISERLKVSRPTVTVIVKRLIEEGYAIKNAEHKIFLTEKGEKLAGETLNRNRLFRYILTQLGVDEKTASKDACEMEHAVSAESYEALKRFAQRWKVNDDK